MIVTEDTYKVRVNPDNSDYWAWCIQKLQIGTWNKMIPFVGESATYHFEREEDRLAFVLSFGLHDETNLPERQTTKVKNTKRKS